MKRYKFTVLTHGSGRGGLQHGTIVRTEDQYVEAESEEEARKLIIEWLPNKSWQRGGTTLWQTFCDVHEVSTEE